MSTPDASWFFGGPSPVDFFDGPAGFYNGASVEPIPPTPPIPPGPIGRKKRGGGIRTVVLPPTPERIDDYEPSLPPLTLAQQYDSLLESGAISVDEWVALYMIHGTSPVTA